MALHDSTAYILTGDGDLSPSIPNPASVSGRTHDLVNTNSSNVTWSSTGATPFQVDGTPVATLTVPRGSSTRVQSDGVRWVVVRPTGTRRLFAATGVTDGSGNVTFNFVPAFSTVPVVTHATQTAVADGTECRITALSTSSVTLNARRSPAVTILGFSVLQSPQPAVGFTVHVMAAEGGQG